jgi:hypothetical protein
MFREGHKGSLRQPDALFRVILFLLSAGLIFGCLNDGGASPASESGRPLELTRVEIPGLRPGGVPAGEYVFNSSGEWSDFWSRYHETPAPEFDLRKFTLVAVFLGLKPNPGYSVRVAGATEYRNELVLDVVEYLPSPGLRYIQVVVYPYDAVLISKTGGKIRFEVSRKAGRP